jgi:hypothetical protein
MSCSGQLHITWPTHVPAPGYPLHLPRNSNYGWRRNECLEENGLLWLRGDLEMTQVNTTEKEEDGMADMRGPLCIPRTMQ